MHVGGGRDCLWSLPVGCPDIVPEAEGWVQNEEGIHTAAYMHIYIKDKLARSSSRQCTDHGVKLTCIQAV